MVNQLQRSVVKEGNGTDKPKKGDIVTMAYTGWLHDPSKPESRGKQFDSTSDEDRGDFKTEIGVGRVIQGWDEGVTQMTLGERAVLTIPGAMAYGERGFLNVIPPNASLVFEVQLKAINGKTA